MTTEQTFNERLKATRQSLGLSHAQVASTLKLLEKVIIMMEENQYPSDLPNMFIRGYLRSYAKILGIPEAEVKIALDAMQPEPVQIMMELAPEIDNIPPITSSNYKMQFFTYAVGVTVVGMVGFWWFGHGSKPKSITAPAPAPLVSNTISPAPSVVIPPITPTAQPAPAKKVMHAYANTNDNNDDNDDNSDDSDNNNGD